MLIKPSEISVSVHKAYAEDGIELDALLFEPKEKTKKIIIHVHGKEGNFIQNHFVTHMGYTYSLHGYSFMSFNNRGHDYMADMIKKSAHGFEWTTHGAAYEQIEESPYDINGIINYVKKLGYDEIILQGHSLGPHKICYYLGNNPKYKISKVILLTPADFLYLLDTTVPNWKKHSEDAKKLINEGKQDQLMPVKLWSNSPVSAKTFLHYTRENSNTWIFNFSNSEFEFKYFNTIKLPMLLAVPEEDFGRGVTAEEEIAIAKEKTISVDFKTKIILNAVHNFASKEEELVKVVTEWLNS